MADYSKGKIYKIFNTIDDDIYVGSTVETLQKRFTRHKCCSTKQKTRHFRIYQKMNDIGFDNFCIQLLEEYPCRDKTELNAREGHWIRQIGTLNTKIQGRTRQEWKDGIKDITKEKAHTYYTMNKEKMNKASKINYENNKDYYKVQYKNIEKNIKSKRTKSTKHIGITTERKSKNIKA